VKRSAAAPVAGVSCGQRFGCPARRDREAHDDGRAQWMEQAEMSRASRWSSCAASQRSAGKSQRASVSRSINPSGRSEAKSQGVWSRGRGLSCRGAGRVCARAHGPGAQSATRPPVHNRCRASVRRCAPAGQGGTRLGWVGPAWVGLLDEKGARGAAECGERRGVLEMHACTPGKRLSRKTGANAAAAAAAAVPGAGYNPPSSRTAKRSRWATTD